MLQQIRHLHSQPALVGQVISVEWCNELSASGRTPEVSGAHYTTMFLPQQDHPSILDLAHDLHGFILRPIIHNHDL
jgi:hypothetical protein